MNRSIWLVKKNHLYAALKKLSDYYGGDDPEWFKNYFAELVDCHRNDLDEVIKTVQDMLFYCV